MPVKTVLIFINECLESVSFCGCICMLGKTKSENHKINAGWGNVYLENQCKFTQIYLKIVASNLSKTTIDFFVTAFFSNQII